MKRLIAWAAVVVSGTALGSQLLTMRPSQGAVAVSLAVLFLAVLYLFDSQEAA